MSENYDGFADKFTYELVHNLQNIADIILNLKKENDTLKTEIENIKADIVLTKNQINYNGRPQELTDEDIEFIKNARAEGLSLRKIAEMIDKSHTTVSRVLNKFTKL